MATGSRGIAIALAKVTPKLSSSTLNREAVTRLGNPAKVLFYDLGNGHTIVQPYNKGMARTLFDDLKKRKAILGGRVFSLSIRGGSGVFRTPSWIRKLGHIVTSNPVAGYTVKGYDKTLYFNFNQAARSGEYEVKNIATMAIQDGKQALAAATCTFDDLIANPTPTAPRPAPRPMPTLAKAAEKAGSLMGKAMIDPDDDDNDPDWNPDDDDDSDVEADNYPEDEDGPREPYRTMRQRPVSVR